MSIKVQAATMGVKGCLIMFSISETTSHLFDHLDFAIEATATALESATSGLIALLQEIIFIGFVYGSGFQKLLK